MGKRRAYNGRRDACSTRRSIHGRDARATTKGVHQTCQTAKRTHFIFYQLSMEGLCLEGLVVFAGAFANGFVLGKRSHWEGCKGLVAERQNRWIHHEVTKSGKVREADATLRLRSGQARCEVPRRVPQCCGISGLCPPTRDDGPGKRQRPRPFDYAQGRLRVALLSNGSTAEEFCETKSQLKCRSGGGCEARVWKRDSECRSPAGGRMRRIFSATSPQRTRRFESDPRPFDLARDGRERGSAGCSRPSHYGERIQRVAALTVALR